MHFTLPGYPQCDFVSIFKYDWAPNSNALHAPRVSTKWFCNDIWILLSSHHLARVSTKWFFINIYIRLSSEQWGTSPSEGIHNVILYWYLYTIELRTVMHFMLRGYPQSDFVMIFAYDWAPNCDTLHLARVSTKWFCMDIYIRLSSEQSCTSRSEGIHKLISYWYLHTIELRTVMHTSLEMHAE